MSEWIYKFGFADAVTAAPAIVWTGWANGAAEVFPAAEGQLALASSSAEDNPAGTGVGTVVVSGVTKSGSDILPFEETVTLNGVGSVNGLTTNAFRVFRMKSTGTAGANGTNVGTITASIGGVACAEIAVGSGQTEMALLTTPSDRGGFLRGYFLTLTKASGASPRATVRIFMRDAEGPGPWRSILSPSGLNEGAVVINDLPGPGVTLPPGCDIKMEITEVTNTASISGGFNVEYPWYI